MSSIRIGNSKQSPELGTLYEARKVLNDTILDFSKFLNTIGAHTQQKMNIAFFRCWFDG